MISIAGASYGLAAVAFLFVSVVLTLHHRAERALLGLRLACFGSAVWATAMFAMMWAAVPSFGAWVWALDAAHAAVWLAFLGTLLPGDRGWRSPRRLLPLTGAGATLLFVAFAITERAVPSVSFAAALLLSLALLGLVAIEQIYRNADLHERQVLKLLCIALGALFAFELFVYSHALLLAHLDPSLWASRGFVNALVVVPLLIGAKRHPKLAPDLFVSRAMAFHSATLVGAGLYLLAMALGGYAIRLRGGEWGPVLQTTFFAAAGLMLVFILASSSMRARLRVLLSKHFFRYKYDYRDEWLRLISTMSDRDGGSAPQRALRALAVILRSASGQLWISRGPGRPYSSEAALGPPTRGNYPPQHVLVRFLDETNWIVDTEEYQRDPARYSHALHELSREELVPAAVIVPLRHEDRLLGFARLERPAGLGPLNFEDHDLLKTVGRQMAVFVEQELIRDRLAETRQFEAFNRTTAFLMHDLKNLMAQQALIVRNAPRFKHNPAFVDDMVSTVERGVERMRKVLEVLQSGTAEPARSRVSLTAVLEEAVEQAAIAAPAPTLELDGRLEVFGDRDRLAMILSHAIRNAQDATPDDGSIVVQARLEDGDVVIRIVDTGKGMDEEFVRTRLFRPFDTTKGATGMGIGAYQIREYVERIGGRVEVVSAPGRGTSMALILPAAGERPLVATAAAGGSAA